VGPVEDFLECWVFEILMFFLGFSGAFGKVQIAMQNVDVFGWSMAIKFCRFSLLAKSCKCKKLQMCLSNQKKSGLRLVMSK